MSTPVEPSKPVVLRALLGQHASVKVHIDSRRPGTTVPERVAATPALCLEYGLALPIPIPDLDVDDFGIRATLSFDGQPSTTWIPWRSVWAILATLDGRTYGHLWGADVPLEMRAIAEMRGLVPAVPDPPHHPACTCKTCRRRGMTLVPGDPDDVAPADDRDDPRSVVPALRIVRP